MTNPWEEDWHGGIPCCRCGWIRQDVGYCGTLAYCTPCAQELGLEPDTTLELVELADHEYELVPEEDGHE